MAHPMTRVTAAAVAATTVAGLTAATAGASTAVPTQRGTLVSATHLRTMSAEQARTWLKSDHFDASQVKYGVDTYRLVYRTIDARHRPTTASGLLVLPRNQAKTLRTVSYTHGTMSYKPDAPSVAKDVWGSGPAVTYGAAGFAAVSPDYLGLGLGPGVHPWKNVPSETTASMDMLRAARQAAARHGRTLDRRVLVTGFSQGASSALGLARALQAGNDPWFRLRAVAPISGGYDFKGAELPALLGGKVPSKIGVAYTTYLLTSWNRIHGLYSSPQVVFKKPYAGRVNKLFDGTTRGDVMLKSLPDRLDQLLTPRGMAMLRKPTGRFERALIEDRDAPTAWTPHVPIRLYKISNDEQAVTLNTTHYATWLRRRGVKAPVIDVGGRTYGGSRHLGSNLSGTAQIVRWFETLR
ncbi:hypothetical protein J4573_23715 [Actinomadura barringtoniae]|uniref:Lipase n=1 Tax=Actinomadura barringtoniae TaxID=1427535 RepID=A0A939PCJ1_9ACTN|nr:hypothetical protein [Actinomadura barringtoniae]MBO2450131.1 hypothetical protein [Actinomadura barringtoniae]